jgi:putative transposase
MGRLGQPSLPCLVGTLGLKRPLLYTWRVEETGRKSLPHDRPLWLSSNEVYFVTICALPRGGNLLAKSEVAKPLIESFVWRHEQLRWHGLLFLVMPDHVHLLIRENPERPIAKEIRDWKKFVARTQGIPWQRDFFEHRLRSNESRSEKFAYILNNPVRAGLVNSTDEWPFCWSPQEEKSDG